MVIDRALEKFNFSTEDILKVEPNLIILVQGLYIFYDGLSYHLGVYS